MITKEIEKENKERKNNEIKQKITKESIKERKK